MTYKQIKNELQNYRQYLKDIENLKEQIKNVWYEMTGVKGVSFDRIPTSHNPVASELHRLDLMDKKDELMLEYEHAVISVKLIELKLMKLSEEDKRACLRIMSDGESYEKVGNDMGYTSTGLWRKLKRELEKV